MSLNIFFINKPPEEEKETMLQRMLRMREEEKHSEKMEVLQELQRTNRLGSFHEGGG